MKKKTTTILFILIFLAGLSLLIYPTFSNYWNSIHASEAVTSYREATDSMNRNEYDKYFGEAENYNLKLAQNGQNYIMTEEQEAEYYNLLNINGIMGFIEIPSIDVELPIYHGTDESVLQTSVGHLEWTSLPVGGQSTHCVLSGHRGLPSAKLFTDLDDLEPGDRFMITVLNKTITYEVDSIETVKPSDVENLKIKEGEDLCTLFTCTPYGINTHRLLVHGHRVENTKEPAHITSDAVQIEPIMVMPFIALPLLIFTFALMKKMDAEEYDEGVIINEESSE